MALNAHNDEKIPGAQKWLDAIPSMRNLIGVGLVLHATESCENAWIMKYLQDASYRIRFVLIVYPTSV